MTPTIETKISQAIQARVATIEMPYPVIWTDDEPTGLPTANRQPAPYIEAHIEAGRLLRRFIGSSAANEYSGLLLLTLCWPIAKVGSGSGKTPGNTIREVAGQIASHFPADLPMDFEGVRVRLTQAADVLSPYRADVNRRAQEPGASRVDTYLRTQIRATYSAFA